MEFYDAPIYDVKFTIQSVNSGFGSFDDKITISYFTEFGDFGQLSMTGSELRRLNRYKSQDKTNWEVDLSSLLDGVGINSLDIQLDNAESENDFFVRPTTVLAYVDTIYYCQKQSPED